MDVLPSGNIFHELQVVHDTGYYDGKVSPEEHWQQVGQKLVYYSIFIFKPYRLWATSVGNGYWLK